MDLKKMKIQVEAKFEITGHRFEITAVRNDSGI